MCKRYVRAHVHAYVHVYVHVYVYVHVRVYVCARIIEIHFNILVLQFGQHLLPRLRLEKEERRCVRQFTKSEVCQIICVQAVAEAVV